MTTKDGFTIIELIITVGVVTLLSAILILYTRTGENQLILFQEQAKVITVIYKAKTFAIETYSDPAPPCGYGVSFQPPRTMILFKDLASPCASSDRLYSGPSETFETHIIDSRISFSSTLNSVVFAPPDPTAYLTPSQEQATITLTAIGGGGFLPVRINNAGQITTQ